jgi:thiamine pyrophosphokinase
VKLVNETAAKFSRCVICSAGPVADAECLKPLLREDDFFIAADGGLRLAEKLGVNVGQIIADFDSLPEEQALKADTPVFALPVKKNDTDTMAAAREGIKRGYHEFLLLGASGGRLDHTMANFAVMLYLIRHNAKAMLADEQNLVEMILPGRTVIVPV